MTATEAASKLSEIAAHAADAEIRTCRLVAIGTVAAHQGDVYLHRVDDAHPRLDALGTLQVAVGTTVGSRHVVEGEGVAVFAGQALPPWMKPDDKIGADAYLGPVVVASEPFTLTHPEHAHHALPAGVYQVTYQVDFSTRRAVQD